MKDYSKVKQKCCICGKEFTGLGNNPRPVREEGRCCDECDNKYVLTSRLFIMELLRGREGR